MNWWTQKAHCQKLRIEEGVEKWRWLAEGHNKIQIRLKENILFMKNEKRGRQWWYKRRKRRNKVFEKLQTCVIPNMQGKLSPPLCQVQVQISLKVAKQQMNEALAWIHLLCKWEQGQVIFYTEDRGKRTASPRKVETIQICNISNGGKKQSGETKILGHFFYAFFILGGWR